jgi:hypothetical protein
MGSGSSTLILLGVGAAILLGLLLLGGSAPTETTEPTTVTTSAAETAHVAYTTPALRVDAGSDITVGERETVELQPNVFGATEGTVSYYWTAKGALGFFADPTARNARYTAPSACDCESSVWLTLTVVDAYGVSASDTLLLTVRDPLACPLNVCEAEPVCASPDLCIAPPIEKCAVPDVPCDSPCVSEVAPTDPCDVIIACPCVDGDCGPIWMESWPFEPCSPTRPADRPKPSISRQLPSHLAEGASVKLTGAISNPACVSGCFVWVASKGTLEDADTLTPTYHAPLSDRSGGEPVTISLVLYDGSGGRSYDQIRLTIDNLDYDGPRVP